MILCLNISQSLTLVRGKEVVTGTASIIVPTVRSWDQPKRNKTQRNKKLGFLRRHGEGEQ